MKLREIAEKFGERPRVRLDEKRRQVALERRRLEMEVLLSRAVLGEKVDLGTATPFWNDYLKPLLAAQVSAFAEKDVIMQMEPKDFALHQFAAQKFQHLLDQVDSLRGVAPECKKRAGEILREIEAAEAEGLMQKKEPEA